MNTVYRMINVRMRTLNTHAKVKERKKYRKKLRR